MKSHHLKPGKRRGIFAIRCLAALWAIVLIGASLWCAARIPQPGVVVRYFDNPHWRGEPVLMRTETQIDLATHQQLVAAEDFPVFDFSVSWTAWVRIDAEGDYRMTLSSDDGSSLFLDDFLRLDNGGFHGLKTVEKEIFLTEGVHKITVNYFNGPGIAEFDAAFARDHVRGPDEKVTPERFFPRPLSGDALFFTRHPFMLRLLHGAALAALAVAALFWAYPSGALPILRFVDMVMKGVIAAFQQPHVLDALQRSRLFHILLKVFFLLSLFNGYLWWKIASCPHGLHGSYYVQSHWQGEPWASDILETDISDQSENFRQIRQHSDNRFSIIWRGYIYLNDTGEYTFFTKSDGSSRLFIDNRLVVEKDEDQELLKHQGKIFLTKGLHRLRILYGQAGGDALFETTWKPARVIVMDTPEIPLYADMLFPPDISPRQFQMYRVAKAALPFLALGWIFLIPGILVVLLRPDFRVHLLWQRICDFQARVPRRVKLHVLIAFLALTASMYASTGTLSPYANTTRGGKAPLVEPECQYLYNADYSYFKALFLMLDGAHEHEWSFSIVLRRILYNLFAYPFMRLIGHDAGGIVVNFLLTWMAYITFLVFIFHAIGERGTLVSAWLLALYPGIFYYVGQPFLYACIVPGCLWLYILLWKLERRTTTRDVVILSSLMGILFLGYDFIVFFGPAAAGILLLRKRYLHLPIAVGCMLVPSVLWGLCLAFYYGGLIQGDNANVYGTILKSYLFPKDFQQWLALLQDVPRLAVINFFFSTFFFLPLLFVCVLLISVLFRQTRFHLVDMALLSSIALLFFLNHAAPPYEGWQMRGAWIARIYQPIFVAFLVFIARMYQSLLNARQCGRTRLVLHALLMLTLLGNGLVVWGPILNDPLQLSSQVYWRFYRHDPVESMSMNLAQYGRRPLGFCRSMER